MQSLPIINPCKESNRKEFETVGKDIGDNRRSKKDIFTPLKRFENQPSIKGLFRQNLWDSKNSIKFKSKFHLYGTWYAID